MTTTKRLLLFASLPLAAAVTLGILSILPYRPGITKANFDRIEKGITKAEVERIFGEPAVVSFSVSFPTGATGLGWRADGGSVANIGSVCSTEWIGVEEHFFDKIRRWLHLQ
jgi:hypothetical protein